MTLKLWKQAEVDFPCSGQELRRFKVTWLPQEEWHEATVLYEPPMTREKKIG